MTFHPPPPPRFSSFYTFARSGTSRDASTSFSSIRVKRDVLMRFDRDVGCGRDVGDICLARLNTQVYVITHSGKGPARRHLHIERLCRRRHSLRRQITRRYNSRLDRFDFQCFYAPQRPRDLHPLHRDSVVFDILRDDEQCTNQCQHSVKRDTQ